MFVFVLISQLRVTLEPKLTGVDSIEPNYKYLANCQSK